MLLIEKKKVLLLAFDPAVAQSILEWLQDYATVTYVSAEEAIFSTIKSQKWDLIITDVKLPNVNDFDITKFVKSINYRIPVLIVADHQKVSFILSALEIHADGMQFKPLNKIEFMGMVFKLVGEYEEHHGKEGKVVLAIGAHPDDVEIGCGGALARHRAEGDSINILTLSQGESGGDPGVRRKESELAAEIQGAKLYWGNFKDTRISGGVETIQHIERIINEVKPTHIYTHTIFDTHRDHRNVHHAVVSACRGVHNIFCFQSPSSTVEFKPNLFIEIFEEDLQQKLRAVAAFDSQAKIRAYMKEDMLRATVRYWGRFCHYALAEPVEVLRSNPIPNSRYLSSDSFDL